MKPGDFLASRWRYLMGAILLVLLAGAAALMIYRPDNGEPETQAEPPSHVSSEMQAKIDGWIHDHGLNRYGDKPGTHYAGGTPLFNERTGERKNRYDYILERHPEVAGPPKQTDPARKENGAK
jgi:hypothetical protein